MFNSFIAALFSNDKCKLYRGNMKNILTILCVLITSNIFPQQFSIKGKVTEKLSGSNLSYANIRVAGSTLGTAANFEGNYEIKLKSGKYTLIASFIGYKSDTSFVNLTSDKTVDFKLNPVPVRLNEITVLPKENPALEIIRRAIAAKHEREKLLNSYVFNAYTKGIVKTTKDFTTSDRSASYSIGTKDTGALKITGIIENISKGYFKKPDQYKDEIIARKQSANTPSTINVLTGGRLLQNFYTNDIRFFDRPLMSPIADDALDYYYYIIEDTLAMDNRNVFKINFEPIDTTNPGFYGDVFIADSLFTLVKLDVNLNRAANPGGIFDKINIFQQFMPYDNNIYMPIDYRVFVEGNFLGIAKFGFELNSVFTDYKINAGIDDDFFDMAIVKVLPDADKKDSTFWKLSQTIPNSLAEIEAYKRIDSLEAIPHTFWDNFSFLATSLYFNENYYITGPLELYSFNKIEGHTLNFGGGVTQELDRRLYGNINFSYGFSDKKFKTDLNARYYFGESRTGTLYFKAYDKLTDLFGESIMYNNLTSTLTSLFGKYDFRDYYYTRGWEFNIAEDVFPVLRLGAGISNRTDISAVNGTDFSFFNRSKTYKTNQQIYDTKINGFSASFMLDFRKYIEDGYRRIRTSLGNAYVTLNGSAFFSNKSFLKSSLNYNIYQLNLNGRIPTFKSSVLSFSLKGIYSGGPVPYQMMYALPGNIESISKSSSFRTLDLGEVYGDRGVIVNLQHNFNDELFRLLKIPVLKDMQLRLNAYVNAAFMEISPKSKAILPAGYQEFKHPFYEVGFGIGHFLIPFTVEFTWKLNYTGKNDFVISMNTFVL